MFTSYIRQVSPSPITTVLDLGCGHLRERLRADFGDKYWGTDINPSCPCDEVMDAEKNHYEDAFHVVSAFSVIEHVENPMLMLRLMLRACKVGVIVSTDFQRVDMDGDPDHLYAWTPKVFRQFMSRVGTRQNVWHDGNVLFGVTYKI